ncbi:MAG: replicative DNA helicase [Candidatus Dormibacteria bacterium]
MVIEQAPAPRMSLEGRVLPHNPESEQAVLGVLMLSEEAIDKVIDILQVDDFHLPEHRAIFSAALALNERGHKVDLITVTSELKARQDFDRAGGTAYLSELQQMVPYTIHVEDYARAVAEQSRRRRLIQAGLQVIDVAFESGLQISEITDRAQQVVYEAATDRAAQDFSVLSELLKPALDQMEKARTEGRMITGVRTGFYDLDLKTSGFQPGNLIILAGRPSMGKTSLALNMAQYAAVKDNVPVCIFSLEMSSTELTTRVLCAEARINAAAVRTSPTDGDITNAARAVGRLERAPLFINDQATLTVTQLRSKARRLKSLHPEMGLIVVDYLQLLVGESKRRDDNRVQEVSAITRSLKGLARELEVPILVLSQLNRAPENRTGDEKGRPQLSDLRESGSIEQDADLVLFVYRPEYYQRENPDLVGKAELIIGKHRNGPVGTVNLRFEGKYTRFEPMDTSGRDGPGEGD